jgi:hypothetical protein
MMERSRPGRATPTLYCIVVRGELSHRYALAFEGMTLARRDGHTVITGEIVDQAQLHGLLDRVRDLGLELVSVNATAEPPPAAAAPVAQAPAPTAPGGRR